MERRVGERRHFGLQARAARGELRLHLGQPLVADWSIEAQTDHLVRGRRQAREGHKATADLEDERLDAGMLRDHAPGDGNTKASFGAIDPSGEIGSTEHDEASSSRWLHVFMRRPS